jgi:hypothetical protein
MSRVRSHVFAVLTLVLLPAALHTGCGSSDSAGALPPSKGAGGSGAATSDGGLTGGNAGTAGQAGATDGGAAAGGAAASGAGGQSWPDAASEPFEANFGYDAPVNDSSLTEDSACAEATAEAKPVPLDLYLMQDSTSSMGTDCNVGAATTSKWCHAINAVAGFVNDPSSAGNQIALQFFSTTINSTCNGSYYANPAVALGLLPNIAPQIVASLNSHSPNGNTPTEAALRGIATYTAAHQTPGRVMIGILVTDGIPTACSTGAAALATIAGQHFQNTGIRTFVIGMTGANFTTLETIAASGGADAHPNYCSGTPTCHYYNVADGDPQAFIAALKDIQQSAIGCTYQMPTPDGGLIDPAKVVVRYTPGGGVAQELNRVNDATQCVAGAWYYDNNAAPTTINLCPDTCNTVKADQNPKVDILLGCQGS